MGTRRMPLGKLIAKGVITIGTPWLKKGVPVCAGLWRVPEGFGDIGNLGKNYVGKRENPGVRWGCATGATGGVAWGKAHWTAKKEKRTPRNKRSQRRRPGGDRGTAGKA